MAYTVKVECDCGCKKGGNVPQVGQLLEGWIMIGYQAPSVQMGKKVQDPPMQGVNKVFASWDCLQKFASQFVRRHAEKKKETY